MEKKCYNERPLVLITAEMSTMHIPACGHVPGVVGILIGSILCYTMWLVPHSTGYIVCS